MYKRLLIPALIALVPIAAMVLQPGCGIISAPVTVPMAIAANANFSLDLNAVDQQGNPLDGILLSQQLNHTFWEPIQGETITDEHKNRRVDRHVEVNERGSNLNVVLSREGYLDANFTVQAHNADTLGTNQGSWHNAKNFPAVMVSREKVDAPLRIYVAFMGYSDYPNERVIYLPNLWQPGTRLMATPQMGSNRLSWGPVGSTNTAAPDGQRVLATSNVDMDINQAKSFDPGTFYVTLTKQTPRVINAKGDVDPAEINLPAELSLHVSGGDGGFVRIQPRIGYAPIYVADEAPSTGYEPQLTISRERLREMRDANQAFIMDAYEYFYIKAAGHYGKGYVAWSMQRVPTSNAPGTMQFRFGFWMQPEQGATDLTYHRGYVAVNR